MLDGSIRAWWKRTACSDASVIDLRQVHLSEVTARYTHARISLSAKLTFQSVACLVPKQTPIVLEAVLNDQTEMRPEVRAAEDALPLQIMDEPASVAAE